MHEIDQASIDRYLRINEWLKDRYRRPDGWLTTMIGGTPSVYSRLDLAFFRRYILKQ